jgi:hypothetical protein
MHGNQESSLLLEKRIVGGCSIASSFKIFKNRLGSRQGLVMDDQRSCGGSLMVRIEADFENASRVWLLEPKEKAVGQACASPTT